MDDEEISDEKFKAIANILADRLESLWSKFMLNLGITDDEIEEICNDSPHDIIRQTEKALKIAWDRFFFPTWEDIKRPLERLHKFELIREIEEDIFFAQQKKNRLGFIHKVVFVVEKMLLTLHDDDSNVLKFKDQFDAFPNSIYDFDSTMAEKYIEKYFKSMEYLEFNTEVDDISLLGFKEYIHSNKEGFVVKGYSIRDHYERFFGFGSHSYFQSECDCSNIFIGYESKNNCFYFIQMSEGNNVEEIKESVDSCTSYVQMFALLFKNMLIDSSVNLIPIVVIPNHAEDLISQVQCHDCESSIFTKRKFSFFKEAIKNMFNYFEIKTNKCFDKTFSKKIFAYIVDYMASESIKIFEKENSLLTPQTLSTLQKVSSKEIKNLLKPQQPSPEEKKILLTPEQVAIRNSKSSCIVIQGCYGSGKTMLLELRMKMMARKYPTQTFYLIKYNRPANENNPIAKFGNIVFIDLDVQSHYDLSTFISNIQKMHNNREVHLFIDNYSLHETSEEEMKALIEAIKYLLSQNSTVCIATNGGFKNKHCKNILKQNDIDSLIDVKTLYENTRSYFTICNLVQKAIDILMKKRKDIENKYYEAYQGLTSLSRSLPDLVLDSNAKIAQNSKIIIESFLYFKNETQLFSVENVGEKPMLFYFKGNNEEDANTFFKHFQSLQKIHEKYSQAVDSFVLLYFTENISQDIFHKLQVIVKLFQKDSKDFFIIKSLSEVHGLEFDNIVIYCMLDKLANQNFNLVEAVSRCKKNLQLIVYRGICDSDKAKHGILFNIFTRWIESGLVEKIDFDQKKLHKQWFENNEVYQLVGTIGKYWAYLVSKLGIDVNGTDQMKKKEDSIVRFANMPKVRFWEDILNSENFGLFRENGMKMTTIDILNHSLIPKTDSDGLSKINISSRIFNNFKNQQYRSSCGSIFFHADHILIQKEDSGEWSKIEKLSRIFSNLKHESSWRSVLCNAHHNLTQKTESGGWSTNESSWRSVLCNGHLDLIPIAEGLLSKLEHQYDGFIYEYFNISKNCQRNYVSKFFINKMKDVSALNHFISNKNSEGTNSSEENEELMKNLTRLKIVFEYLGYEVSIQYMLDLIIAPEDAKRKANYWFFNCNEKLANKEEYLHLKDILNYCENVLDESSSSES